MFCSIFRYSLLLMSMYLFSFSLYSCKQAHGETLTPEERVSKVQEVKPVSVKVQKAERRSFPLRTITTGVLESARQAEIKFLRGGQLMALPIREGQSVAKGELLAEVDDASLQLQLEQSQLALDEATVNKKDLLIANGGDAEQDTSVSAKKLELILTLSGYNKAQHSIKQTKYELSQTKVFALFDGIIANVKTFTFEQVNPGESICTLIDPNSFEVTFSILEQEALGLSKGQSVIISPLAAPKKEHRARITTINPQVNAQGLVRVRAALQSAVKIRLFEGQNVKVVIEKKAPGQLVIPKRALLLRSGREVVFTYDETSGKAQWHYVQSSHQNDEQIVISEGLEEGALVIYDGQMNLAHGTTVAIQR